EPGSVRSFAIFPAVFRGEIPPHLIRCRRRRKVPAPKHAAGDRRLLTDAARELKRGGGQLWAVEAPPVRSGRISGEGRSAMLYEMRVYDCVPGRLPALLKRFETVTLGLWQKHGIRQAGFFTTLIGEHNQQLTYFLAWESLAEREKKWNTFMSDPEWLSARAASEKDGPILTRVSNQMLVPTSFSSVK